MEDAKASRPRSEPSGGMALLALLLATFALGAAPLARPTSDVTVPPLPAPQPPAAVASSPELDPGAMLPGSPLVPDQLFQPIDLASALRLAGARNLDIAIARERVCQAVAELEQARV